jgi:hypothetical protein
MSEPEHRPINDLLAEATDVLRAVDVTDTAAVLTAAWHGFCVAGAAGAVLSYCADPQTYPALWTNAEPVLQQTIVALRTAPSLPAGLPTEITPDGGPDDELDDATAGEVRAAVLTLAGVLNIVLPQAANKATGQDACVPQL